MNPVDRFLNGITMYRLVLYGLLLIAGVAGIYSATGYLGYALISLVASAGVLLAVAWLAHQALWRAFASAPGTGTWLITALILFLILKPAETPREFALLALAAVLGMASRYVLALFNRHIFNPAAIALVILGLLGSGNAFWWVGSGVLLPVVALVGLLVVRKLRRFHLLLSFLAAAILAYVTTRSVGTDLASVWNDVVVSGPLIFLGTIMLTEPATTPPTRSLRMVYGALVGLLYGLSYQFGPVHSTPEMALVLGNLYSYLVSSKRRLSLKLIRSAPQGRGVYEFAFAPSRPIKYLPGQYLEWTLPHSKADSRGNRRYFTIASAPAESEVILGVRIDPNRSSTFKRALLAMQPGNQIWASQLSGDFTLPDDPSRPLVFIAGGIGVTPFRSMIQQLRATGQRRNINLFFTALTSDGFSFAGVFNAAADIGLRTHYIITGPDVPPDWPGKSGYITADMIKAEVPQYGQAYFYLSGPDAMVTSYKRVLRTLSVPAAHIKTDYFPGY